MNSEALKQFKNRSWEQAKHKPSTDTKVRKLRKMDALRHMENKQIDDDLNISEVWDEDANYD